MRLRLEFKPQDCWVGVYWRTKPGVQTWYSWVDVWVCVLPMLPLHIYWPRKRAPAKVECPDGRHHGELAPDWWRYCPGCGVKLEG